MLPFGSTVSRIQLDQQRLQVFSHRPAGDPTGLIVLFHGQSRHAEGLRDIAVPLAEQLGVMLVAPLFPRSQFPPVAYQRGHVTDGRGRPRPASGWTTRLVPLLVDWATGSTDLPYWLWGFSAGGQFLSRVAAFQDLPRGPERFVIVSPSTHVQPQLGRWPHGEAAPYGMGGIFPPEDERAMLVRYLGRPITLSIGEEDNETTDPALGRNAAARRQGPNRLYRTSKTFDLAAMTALRLRCDFGWRLKIVPGVGHAAGEMLTPEIAQAVMDLPAPAAGQPSAAPVIEVSGEWSSAQRGAGGQGRP